MSVLPPAEPIPRWLNLTRDRAWVFGTVGLVLCLALLAIDRTRAAMYPGYLIGFVFWFGIAMGGVSLALLHHLTGGSWGLLVRRPLEAAALVIIPLAVLFIPIALGLPVLYPWARQGDMYERLIQEKVAYLNPTGFRVRAIIYFAIWCTIAYFVARLSRRQDLLTSRRPTLWLQRISGPALGLVFLSGSFAAIDWVMSIEPEWPSSIYPAMLITGWGLATWASMILVAGSLRRTQPIETVATPSRFQDLASLTLAFVMLWAYTSFMQYLIIWSGNLAEEIPWYLRRTRGGWQYFALALITFHFFAPFALLLSRGVKRRAPKLMSLACAILFMHFIDGIWLVLPGRVRDPLSPAIGVDWIQVALAALATLSIGGVCIGFFLTFLRGAPLVPLNDPAVDSLGHDHEDEDDEADAPVHAAVGG